MKSYVVLMLVSVPLLLVGYTHFDALRTDITDYYQQKWALSSATNNLNSVGEHTNPFTKIDSNFRLAVLGAGPFPDDPFKPAKGPEEDIAHGFNSYRLGLKSVALFTRAFSDHKVAIPSLTDLVGARTSKKTLQTWLEDRNKPEFVAKEAAVDSIIENNLPGDNDPEVITYSHFDICNTAIVSKAIGERPDDITADFVKKGSMLVLVIKTTDLFSADNPAHLDKVFEDLGDKKAKLIGGRFVLVTNPTDPKRKMAIWNSKLSNMTDAFGPTADPRVVLNSAMAAAREVKSLRAGAPLGPVEIVWIFRGEAPLSGNITPLDGINVFKPTLHWIGPVSADQDRQQSLGDLLPWFDQRVNPIDLTKRWFEVLKDSLERKASR